MSHLRHTLSEANVRETVHQESIFSDAYETMLEDPVGFLHQPTLFRTEANSGITYLAKRCELQSSLQIIEVGERVFTSTKIYSYKSKHETHSSFHDKETADTFRCSVLADMIAKQVQWYLKAKDVSVLEERGRLEAEIVALKELFEEFWPQEKRLQQLLEPVPSPDKAMRLGPGSYQPRKEWQGQTYKTCDKELKDAEEGVFFAAVVHLAGMVASGTKELMMDPTATRRKVYKRDPEFPRTLSFRAKNLKWICSKLRAFLALLENPDHQELTMDYCRILETVWENMFEIHAKFPLLVEGVDCGIVHESAATAYEILQKEESDDEEGDE